MAANQPSFVQEIPLHQINRPPPNPIPTMKTIKSPLNILLSALAAVAVICVSPGANAAAITWGTPTFFAGDTDVVNNRAVLYAYDFSSAQTVNGVSFAAVTSGTHASTNVGYTFGNQNGSAWTTYSGLSTAYRAVLQGGLYRDVSGGAFSTATVTLSNLVVGTTYIVQYWVGDPRGNGNIHSQEALSSSGGNTVTLIYNQTVASGGHGHYCVGTFTADATTQAFTVTSTTVVSNNSDVEMNALQVQLYGQPTNYWGGLVDGNWDSTTANWGYGQTFPFIASIGTSANLSDIGRAHV